MESCCHTCTVPVPDWYSRGTGNGAVTGFCPNTSLKQCNGFFNTDAVDLLPGTTDTDDAVFDVSESNFTHFQPRGLKAHVTETSMAITFQTERALGVDDIDFQGTNYKLDDFNTPLSAFAWWAEHALSMFEIGELSPSGQDVTLTTNTIATNALTYRTIYTMIGYAVRGGGKSTGHGSAIVP